MHWRMEKRTPTKRTGLTLRGTGPRAKQAGDEVQRPPGPDQTPSFGTRAPASFKRMLGGKPCSRRLVQLDPLWLNPPRAATLTDDSAAVRERERRTPRALARRARDRCDGTNGAKPTQAVITAADRRPRRRAAV